MTDSTMTIVGGRTGLEISKITGRIGAEVRGVQPGDELSAETVADVRAALDQHKVLVFRDVDIGDGGQERFCRYFGELTTAHPTIPSVEGARHVLAVDSDRGRSNHWHTDVTFIVNPPQLSTLRSIVVPPYGGETLIANSASAYTDLPEVLRNLADTLWAVHSNDRDYAIPEEFADEAEKARRAEFTSIMYETVHPVVRVHPRTGERGLFIGGFAKRIIGLSVDESRDLLRILQGYVTRPENVLRWRWMPNQLVLLDNRITQHYAVDNYDDLPRRLNRVTVAGDVPVGVNGSRSYSIAGDSSQYSVLT